MEQWACLPSRDFGDAQNGFDSLEIYIHEFLAFIIALTVLSLFCIIIIFNFSSNESTVNVTMVKRNVCFRTAT